MKKAPSAKDIAAQKLRSRGLTVLHPTVKKNNAPALDPTAQLAQSVGQRGTGGRRQGFMHPSP